jgi:hypothetical protein
MVPGTGMLPSRLFRRGARESWLRACFAMHRGAAVSSTLRGSVVAACLADAPGRMTAFGGREGRTCSLASVYACLVTLFLGGWRRVVCSLAALEPARQHHGDTCKAAFAVSGDGAVLVVAFKNRLAKFDVASGALLLVIDRCRTWPLLFWALHFEHLSAVTIDDDGYVYVADTGNQKLVSLTPTLGWCSNRNERNIRALSAWGSAVAVANEFLVTRVSGISLMELNWAWYGKVDLCCTCDGFIAMARGCAVFVAEPKFSWITALWRREFPHELTGIAWTCSRDLVVSHTYGIELVPCRIVFGDALAAQGCAHGYFVHVSAVDAVAVRRDTLFVLTNGAVEAWE